MAQLAPKPVAALSWRGGEILIIRYAMGALSTGAATCSSLTVTPTTSDTNQAEGFFGDGIDLAYVGSLFNNGTRERIDPYGMIAELDQIYQALWEDVHGWVMITTVGSTQSTRTQARLWRDYGLAAYRALRTR